MNLTIAFATVLAIQRPFFCVFGWFQMATGNVAQKRSCATAQQQPVPSFGSKTSLFQSTANSVWCHCGLCGGGGGAL